MIEPEEIAKWAELYDLGYRNLDLSSEEASAARRELQQRGNPQDEGLLEAFMKLRSRRRPSAAKDFEKVSRTVAPSPECFSRSTPHVRITGLR
jgi:hypothetical protein